ncbi:MAG: glycosyltransferase [Carnobacterium sp.]|uniref:glycosyltransferase family 2 protein n=1 Tax=Carnobacterium sp. TaxID=48221 RepID=UPI003C71DBF0
MSVLLIIVVYNKSIKEIKYLNKIKSADILLYDNSRNSQVCPSSYYYYHNNNNDGVSSAYNYGIELAKKLNKEFLILLDQDTTFNENILKTYIKYANKFGNGKIYAPIVKNKEMIYSPFIESKVKNYPQNLDTFSYSKVYSLEGKSLINSGLMIPLNIIADIGNFNEKIKLDFSDIYYIEKYKKKYNEVILIDTYLEHKLSGDEGKNKHKELKRYKFYCNGAKELKKTTKDISRVDRLVFFRMLRLVIKYNTLTPLFIFKRYYLGGMKV